MPSNASGGPLGFGPLFVMLGIALLVVDPLADAGYGGIASALASPALFATAALAVRESGRFVWIAFVAWALIAVIGGLIPAFPEIRAATRLVDALFVGFLGFTVLRIIVASDHVSLDTILGGMAVYLILAVFFSSLYSAVELLAPGSFLDRGAPLIQAEARLLGGGIFPDLTYYSLVTMTTLGYGDIVPVTALTRSLAAAQAVLGQFYVAVLIAFLVGIYTATSRERINSQDDA